MSKIKRIGVLTSGGDCSGLNSIIRAIINAASLKNWEVYGIKNGTDGLTETPKSYEILTEKNFSNTPWPRISGSYLGSLNTGVKVASIEEMSRRFAKGLKELQLDALVVIGGDGSMNICSNYAKNTNVKIIGIPKTIDNDTPITEASIGFNSACQQCMNAFDNLDLTARSHNRALIVEVMGRDAGHLAMHSAIAGYADICIVPEIPYTIEGIIKKLKAIKATGRSHSIIVISEGIKTENGEHVSHKQNMVGENVYGGVGEYLNQEISKKYDDFQIRVTTLGHTQRSGNPTLTDRLMATMFGAKAIDLLDKGRSGEMVIWKNGKIDSYPITGVVKAGTTLLDPHSDYIKTALAMGMYIGEVK